MTKKKRDMTKYPLRMCYTMQDCFICQSDIFCGEQYYDGGSGHRAHKLCAENQERKDGE